MLNSWRSVALGSVLVLSTVCLILWKKKKTYVKVARIAKLYFYPVKSLKGIEVLEGKCTKRGFEVNGILDRTFMLVNANSVLVSQRDCPSLVHLTPSIENRIVTIISPSGKTISIPVKETISNGDKIFSCNIFGDIIDGMDCGDEVATWFQDYLGRPDVRLVQQFPSLPDRKYTKNNSYFELVKKDHPVGFQDLSAFHILSQASIDHLNFNLEKEKNISLKNFRPNILVEDCEAYAEDTWQYILFNSGASLIHIMLTTRCLLTTNNPETGELTQKEPLVTLRKFRLAKDPKVKALTGSVPCFGVACGVLKSGDIKVGDDVFAVCTKQPEMIQK